ADMQRQIEAVGIPGAAIAIVCNDRLNFAAGVGLKRHDLPDPVQPDTLFHVASLTKMLTAVSVLSLLDQHPLDLSRPITDYLPWFAIQPPYEDFTITTHHLLTHQSGIPSMAGLDCPKHRELEDFFREGNPTQLYSAPGRYWNYKNTGYMLAGLL